MCLRDKRTKQIYNVSYTEAGLVHTFQAKNGAPLYYNPQTTYYSTSTNSYFNPSFKGKKDKNPAVYVEKYVPMNHFGPNGLTLHRMQTAEIFFAAKAQRLAMPMNSVGEKNYLELKQEFEELTNAAAA